MKKRNPLMQFFIGLLMLVAGGYWFMSTVTVTTGFLGGLSLWGFNIAGGLVVVPFIAGIIWLFLNFDSLGAKIMVGVGLVIILASVIINTHFIFQRRSLYEYLIMLLLIFGGAALSLQVLCAKPKETKKKEEQTPREEYEDLENRLDEELEQIRKGL